MMQKLKKWARMLKRDGVTLWFACKDPRTPWMAKALAALVVAYALSPIDPIPDFIPILGLLDELIVLPGLIWLAIRLIPETVLEASRARADAWMFEKGSKPRTAWGLIVVVLVWGTFIALATLMMQ
ncbi:MAG TPA: DUF1232 domain-containing protein [Burkholderiales bacterium]|nr:DUF1232 domain-containing protein [Burkholderiales bacterium]